ASTTGPQLSTSDLMNSPNCSGVVSPGTAPRPAKRSRTSGLASASRIALFSVSTTSLGMPLGPITPNQDETSKPSKPDSCMVGRSGAVAERAAVLTASAGSLTDSTWGQADGMLSNTY